MKPANDMTSTLIQLGITRRQTLVYGLSTLGALAGCATEHSIADSIRLGAKTFVLVPPSYGSTLELHVSAWARMISAHDLQLEQRKLNVGVGEWREKTVGAFVDALTQAIKKEGRAAHTLTSGENIGDLVNSQFDIIILRSFLTAGFVYKTFTSNDYAPFVQVVLEARTQSGQGVYRQLYIASNRPYNFLMKSIPAETTYTLLDLGSFPLEASSVIEAFTTLASQMGRQFAQDLLRG